MASQLIIGILIGMVVIGAVVFSYVLLKTVIDATMAIRELNTTLKPIFQNDEVIKGFRMLNGISVIADGIGSRMDSLNTTLKLFTSTVFNEAPKNVPVTDTSSGVFRYDEEEAAVNEAAAKLRRNGVEVEEKPAVSANTDDEVPNVF
jgi:hypothetical protein